MQDMKLHDMTNIVTRREHGDKPSDCR